MKHWQLLLLSISADAYPQLKRSSFSGVATFNDYASQSSTVCGQQAGQPGTYAAAASDLSANISGGKCAGAIDPSKCNGQSPAAGYVPPSCPKTNCGTCYSVTNAGKTIIVQIVDSCPSTNAQNFCKTDVPANNRCGAPGVNQLDIDRSAYQALTGKPFGSGGNLEIQISESSCSGGGTDTTGSDTVGADPAGSGTAPAGASNPAPGAQSANQQPQTDANTTSPANLGSQKLAAQPKNLPVEQKSKAVPVPLDGSSTTSGSGGSSNTTTAGESSNAANAGESSNAATAGGSSNLATAGKSSKLATAGKSSDLVTAAEPEAKCVKQKSKTKKKRSLRRRLR